MRVGVGRDIWRILNKSGGFWWRGDIGIILFKLLLVSPHNHFSYLIYPNKCSHPYPHKGAGKGKNDQQG